MIQRASVETPPIWRNQPGPSQYVSLPDCLDHYGPIRSRYLQGDFPFANHKELLSFFAFTEKQLASFEAHIRCTSHDELKVLGLKTLQEWVPRDYRLKCLEFQALALSYSGIHTGRLIRFSK
jgi:hypothetical protein